MIADVIRNADSDREIYLLMAAYVDAMRSVANLSDELIEQPIIDSDDLRARFRQLITELDNASAQLDAEAVPAIKEALHIYGTALDRLRTLDHEQHPARGDHALHLGRDRAPQTAFQPAV